MSRIVYQKLNSVLGLGQKTLNIRQQNIIANGLCRSYPKNSAGLFPQLLQKSFFIVLQGFCILLQNFPLSGLCQAPSGVREQLHPILTFQCLNMLTHCRLGQMQLFRCPPVVQGTAKHQKGFQFLFHRFLLSITKWNEYILIYFFILSQRNSKINTQKEKRTKSQEVI